MNNKNIIYKIIPLVESLPSESHCRNKLDNDEPDKHGEEKYNSTNT